MIERRSARPAEPQDLVPRRKYFGDNLVRDVDSLTSAFEVVLIQHDDLTGVRAPHVDVEISPSQRFAI